MKIQEKWVSYLHRTASTMDPCFLPDLGELTGAGRIRLTRCKSNKNTEYQRESFLLLLSGIKFNDVSIMENERDTKASELKAGVAKSFLRHALNWGLITGGCLILFHLLVYIFDVDTLSPAYGILSFLITLGILMFCFIYGGIRYRNTYRDGIIGWSRSYLLCIITGAVAAVIYSLYTWLFYEFYEPGLLAVYAEKYMAMLAENPSISEEQLDKIAVNLYETMKPVPLAISSLMNYVITSVVFGLLAALFIRKKEKPTATQVY
jgi:hypothetical protein